VGLTCLCGPVLVLAVGVIAQPTTRPTVENRLLADLKSEDAATRLAAVRALVRFREPRVADAINAALQIEPEPDVRFWMLRTLVKLGDRPARALLRTYCLTRLPFWNINLIAASDLRAAGDTAYLDVMVNMGLASDNPEVRGAVLQALRSLRAPETVPLLGKAISTDPGIPEAAHLLAYLEGPAARPILLEALQRRGTAYGAARGLAVIAEPSLVTDLVERLDRPKSAAGAAHALSLIGGPTACSALFNAIGDADRPKAGVQAALAIVRQSFGYGVAGAERRRSLIQWRDWWRTNRAGVGGFENITVPAGLLEVRGVGHRVCWGDFDGDDDDDLLVSGRHLLRNEGGRRFVNVTAKAGIHREDVAAAAWADYNNDGRLDFYAASLAPGAPDSLWRNQGDGTFVDVARDAGRVSDAHVSEAAAWADFDCDGHVDLYVANSRAGSARPGVPPVHDRLYRNKGDGTFADVSRASGITAGPPRTGRGVAWADFDDDGDPDCYVCNHLYQPNRLWRNNGDGTFEDAAPALRLTGRPHQTDAGELFGRSLGCAWADYDNDGQPDLFVANNAPRDMLLHCDQSQLFRNRGRAGGPGGALLGFRDVRGGVGITYEQTNAECAWGDYDNDGDLDLVITSTFWKRRSYLYRNNGDGTFEDVTWVTGTRVLNGGGCAWADFDRDGRLDLVSAGNYGLRLFRNVTRNANRWLQVHLVGTRSNRSAIGARITVTAGGRRQIREVSGGRGTGCQDSFVQHFGLGPRPASITVKVRWPSGNVQVLNDVRPDQRIRVVEKQ